MSFEERTGERDLTYPWWHANVMVDAGLMDPQELRFFDPDNLAVDLTYSSWHRTLPQSVLTVDIDFIEACQRCKWPLAFIETARDIGQPKKQTIVLRNAALLANRPAWVVLYRVEDDRIVGFRIRQIAPLECEEVEWTHWTPSDWGQFLVWMHSTHEAEACEKRPGVVYGWECG